MAILAGRYFMLYVIKDEVFMPVACATSSSITVNMATKPATKPPDSKADSFFSSTYNYAISADGLNTVDDNKVNAMDLMALLLAGEPIMWMMKDENADQYFFSGWVIPTAETITSPATGAHSFNFNAIGTGEISTNNPYHTTFIMIDEDTFATDEDGNFIVEKTIDGDFPDYI